MITLQDLDGNVELYDLLLKQFKRKVSIFKRGTIKGISKKDAAECESLYIKNVEIENLDFLKFFPRLSDLGLDYVTGLKNIDGMCNCNLQVLFLFNTNLDDFDALAKCPSLKKFSYYYDANWEASPCKNVSFVKYLPELEFLQLPGLKADISPILQCYSLQELDISYTPIGSVEQFGVLPRLRKLIAWGCGIETVDFSVFPQLEMIDLRDNPFSHEPKREQDCKYPKILL